MKLYYFIFMLVAALWGCERDTLVADESTGGRYPKDIISFSPQVEEEDVSSRGTPITSVSQMTEIGVFCSYTGSSDWTATATPAKMFNTRLSYNSFSRIWEYNGTPISWNPVTSNDRYSFFAYAPYSSESSIVVQGSSSTAGVPSVSYTVPLNASVQPDLMLAVPRFNLRPSTSMVALQMKHALTCIGFQIQGNGEQIVSVSVSGISSSGTASLDGGNVVWRNLAPPQTTVDYSALINLDAGQSYFTAKPTMSTNLITGNGYLMMIPQTLTANTKLKLTFSDTSTREISLNGQTWAAGKKINYNIIITPDGIITLTPSSCYIPATGVSYMTDNFQLSCTPANTKWTLSSNATWFRLTRNSNGQNAQTTITGQGAASIYTIADANTTPINRIASLYANGNSINAVGTITQLKKNDLTTIINGGTPPMSTTTYVGAFWRANQMGERIIRIPVGTGTSNVGLWTASIVLTDGNWLPDDICLSSALSKDAGISYTQDLTPADAEGFKVTEKITATSGDAVSGGSIYFRIGLNTKYNPTAANPARYAVVVLTYKGGASTQLILLRQGEGADYVMPPSSPTTGTRPLARKISPYNITQSTITNWSGGSQITDHPALSFQGGVFTDYPSQAGAYFQWASTDQVRRAFHPSYPSTAITGWSTLSPLKYWKEGVAGSMLSDIHEVCPSGYKRINDGSETSVSTLTAATSELRQSLFYSPADGLVNSTTNSISGYYADGFFDRRQIKNSPTGDAATTVSYYPGTNNPLNAKIAYSGTLIYNPTTWASIFLPTTGYRDRTGSLNEIGLSGYYWTSSCKVAKSYAVGFMSKNTLYPTIGYEFDRSIGGSVRCVKVP